MATDPLPVEFEGVHKRFERGGQSIEVLAGVDLSIQAGEFVPLMGPAGSGKSTLLNLIAGLDRPTAGRVMVGADEPARLKGASLARWRSRHIGFVFQRYFLLGVLDAAQNVEVPLLLFDLSRAERRRR